MTGSYDEKIQELVIYKPNGYNIFTNMRGKYIIPLYQRAFAWEELQIQQLIEDIYDDGSESNKDYYLGSLIVSSRENDFEVIDGQQRLTTLFLIFTYLDISHNNVLTFECRKKSDNTLAYLSGNKNKDDDLDNGLINGFKIIKEIFEKQKIRKKKFKEKLSHVKIYRIEVPDHTDLNHYFEIINTRGEQLEQTDILKATLLNKIEDNDERKIFAQIWDACADMDGYVQMHFNTDIRIHIFGPKWTDFPKVSLKEIKSNTKFDEEVTIEDILKGSLNKEKYESNEKDNNIIRYESIINFSYFLLHVLKIYIKESNIQIDTNESIVNELLDDKKLLDTFKKVFGKRKKTGEKIRVEEFCKNFILCLLKVRFLFDCYIVKREYSMGDGIGVWSLKELASSISQKSRKPYYPNTDFRVPREWLETSKNRHNHILKMQSCLRVSYTSPKIMHWITHLLSWLYFSKLPECLDKFENEIEYFIAKRVNEDYLKNGNYYLGVNTPHIVFNYLDYLLWKEDKQYNKKKPKYKNFNFEFRNSVEHWHPQHPSENTFDTWNDKDLNYLGNLCIIQRNINSKFSNMSPLAKKDTYEKMIKNGSIKLKIMAQATTNKNHGWERQVSYDHGKEMIILLENAIKDKLKSTND